MAKRKQIVPAPMVEEDEDMIDTKKGGVEDTVDKKIEELDQTIKELDQDERCQEFDNSGDDDDEEKDDDFNYENL